MSVLKEVVKMTLKEFSNMFEMSVNEMCEYTGFSRQGLNEIVKGNSTKNGTKKREALHDLRDRARELRYKERKELDTRYEDRMGTINSLFDKF